MNRTLISPCLLAASAAYLLTPLHAQQPSSSKDEAVVLSPFEVSSATDHGYAALNSNSITLFNTELKKLPITADVFDSTFMQDIGATNVEEMIQEYAAGSGSSNVIATNTVGATQPGDVSNTATLRGLFAPTMQRDGFMPAQTTGATYTRNFDVEHVDIVKGPQSLLYGGGGGSGGIVNVVSKQAMFNKPLYGSAQYSIDNVGSKFGQFDAGAGNAHVALRLSLIQGTQLYSRQFLGGPTSGAFMQLAFRLGTKHVLRLTGEKSTMTAQYGTSPNPSLPTSDPRNNANLHSLLLNGQINGQIGQVDPVTGKTYAVGPIDNGRVNWGNIDSFGTWWNSRKYNNAVTGAILESTWAPWLATQINAGYNRQDVDLRLGGQSLNAPGIGGNPYSEWAVGITPADSTNNNQTKGIRASAVLTNDLFHDRAHSQTIFGADYVRYDLSVAKYGYFLADANSNIIVDPKITSNLGRTPMPKQWVPLDGATPGPYALFSPQTPSATFNGFNYSRGLLSPVDPTQISPANPVGALGANAQNYVVTHTLTHGLFGANFTQWFDGRLTSLVGVRIADIVSERFAPVQNQTSTLHETNFNAGLVYKVNRLVSAFVSGSSSFFPALGQSNDPYGNAPAAAKGIGQEAGLKIADPAGRISASIAAYHVASKNEQYVISAANENYINPNGLNGQWNLPNRWVIVDRDARGLEMTAASSPLPNWNIRASVAYTDSTIGTTVSYAQLYNDQFHANSSGQVTYADGTPVWVLTTPPKTGNAPVAAGTANAQPLTLTMLNTSTNPYYANPQSVTGLIGGGNALAILRTNDAQHGAIATGVTGLPISSIQIDASNNPLITGYIAPPGAITPVMSGDKATGYPVWSFHLTNSYTIASGWLKGLKLGGTVHTTSQYRAYYYYTKGLNGTIGGGGRQIFFMPGGMTFDGILGYSRRFRRVTWSTQLNVYNLFNHYRVYVQPDVVNSYSNPLALSTNYNAQPRSFRWSTTVAF